MYTVHPIALDEVYFYHLYQPIKCNYIELYLCFYIYLADEVIKSRLFNCI